MNNIEIFRYGSEEVGCLITYDNNSLYSRRLVVNDLEGSMKYNKQFNTYSSIIYSARLMADLAYWYSKQNSVTKVYMSVESGWKRGLYFNIIVDTCILTQKTFESFCAATLIKSIALYNEDRILTDEEREYLTEVRSLMKSVE